MFEIVSSVAGKIAFYGTTIVVEFAPDDSSRMAMEN
jgi:hypothetical protein